jgi:hypothetical protein
MKYKYTQLRALFSGFLFFLMLQGTTFAQVNLYDFTQSSGTYTEITGGTVAATATGTTGAASLDDVNYTLAANTIPFNFTFDGSVYTSCIISTNGYITFGATAPTTTVYTPLSSTVAYNGAASAMGGNLNAYFFAGNAAQTGEIRYQTIGTSPNRVFVIQYKNFKTFATSGATFGPVLNFQIRLSETSNAIDYVYNVSGSFATASLQVGVRGANNTFPTNVKNRTVVSSTNTWAASIDGTSNTSTCQVSSTTIPVSGQTYRFAPAACPSPQSLNVSSVTTTSVVLGWTNPVAGGSFTVEYGPAGFTPGTGTTVTTSSNSVAVSGLSVATNYSFYVQKTCSVGSNSLKIGPYNFSTGSLGEDCATAPTINVASSLATCSYTLVNSGLSINGPTSLCSDINGNQATNDRWYKFVAPSNGSKLIITTQAGTVNDWVMEVWSGCPGGTGAVMKCGDDQNAFMPEVQLCQNEYTAGQTYYVRVWTYTAGAVGNMNLCVYQTTACPLPPVNDNCATATRLNINSPLACPGNGTVGTTMYATPNTDAASCDATTGKQDVWYVFNTGSFSDLNVTVSNISATNVKAQLLFECGGFEIACWNPANGAHLITGLNPVADYVLRVWTDAAGAGTFSVCVSDVCSNPTATISGTQSVCTGQSASIPVTFTGVAPFTFVYNNGTSNTNVSTSANPYNLVVTPSANTTYTLVSMTDAACSGTVSGTHTVNLITPLNATLSAFSPVCANAPIQNLSGGSPAGGVYSGVGVSGTTFNPAVGTQTITYTVTYATGCTRSASQVFTVNALPTVVLNSLGSVCLNDPAFTLTTGTPSGGTYSGSGVSNNIFTPSVAGLGSKIITYSYTSVQGCPNTDTALIVVNSCTAVCSNPPTANAGVDKTICANAAASITGSIGGSATTLTWSGGTGTYSPNTSSAALTYTPSTAEKAAGFVNLVLTANDPDGTGPCVAATDTVKINITALPSIGSISGSSSVCKSQSGLVYSVVNQSGITYTWTVPTGASIISGQGTNAIVINYSGSAVSGTIGVTGTNSCGSATGSLAVTVNAAPTSAPITGNSITCLNQTGVVYSTPAQTGMTYTWTVPSGVNITVGAGTNSITTTWTASAVSGVVSLQIGNACGTLTSSTAVTVSTAPTTPTVTGTATLCAGAAGVTYSITAQSGMSYVWTVPSNVTITGGQGTNSITTTWSASAASGSVSVAVSNSCGTTNGSFAVTVNKAPTTPSITGNASVCPNTTGVVYSVVAQSGASYVWTVPANVTITAGQGTNSITTTWSATAASGNVGVTLSNSCGNASTTFAVTVGTAPATTIITGSTLICGAQTGITYTVPSQSGATYTWTVPANVTITSGQGSNTIITSWAAGAASGNVGISISTSCGTTTGSLAVTKSNAPTTPSVTGTATLCAGATGVTYSITAQSGASYVWTVPANVTITAGQGTNTITTTWSASAVSGSVSIAVTNSCGTTNGSFAVTVNKAPTTPAITGNSNVCPNTTGVVYSVVAQSGASYVWTVPANVTITAGQGTNSITTTWSASAASGNVGVTLSNSCGNASTTFAVTVGTAPATTTITGSTLICGTQTAITYTVPSQSGATYTWTVPANVTITSGQGSNTIITSWAAGAASGNVGISISTSCGTTTGSLAVTKSNAPTTPTITGTSNVCPNTTGIVYSITAQSGVSYVWTIPSGVTITAGQGTNSITTTWGSSAVAGNVAVAVTNTCGTTNASYAVTVGTGVNIGSVSGPVSICTPQTAITYSVPNISGVTFTWSLPTGVSIVSGQGSNSIVTSWSVSAVSGNITVVGTNSCGSGLSSLPVTTNQGFSVGTITGTTPVCRPATGVVYSVPNQAGVTYTWTVPANVTITAGQGTSSITTTWSSSSTSGTVSVSATGGCGTATASLSVVVRTALPSTPGTVTGNSSACRGDVFIYKISKVATADYYSWIPSSGMLVNGSSTAISIPDTFVTVTFLNTYVSDTLKVRSGNCKGLSNTTRTKLIARKTTAPSTPGTILGQVNTLCGVTSVTYSFNTAVAGAVSYTWRTNIAGALLNGQATAVTVNAPDQTVVLTFPANWTGTGNIYVKANNGCGSSAEKTVALTSRPAAPAAIIGSTTQCKGATNQAYSIAAVVGATSYTWTMPTGVTLVSGQGTTNVVVNFNTVIANRTLKVVANNACGASSAKTLVVAVAACPAVREGSLTSLSNVEIYPNPSKGLLSVNFNSSNSDNYMLTVSDLSGRVLRMIPVSAVEGENKVNLELTDVSTGVYILTLKGNSDISQTRVVIE